MTNLDTQTRVVVSWLREDAHENAERVLLAALNEIDHTQQRRSWWPTRRSPDMNNLAKVLVATAAVVAVLVVGMQFLRSAPGGVGAAPSASPSPTPAPTPQVTAAAPSASAATGQTPPPLSASFSSTQHGISMSYPEGWTTQAATAPWTESNSVRFIDPQFDVLYDPILTDHLFLSMASQPISDATPEDWMAMHATDVGCTTTEPIQVDGATGLIGGCDADVAVVTIGGRGYQFQLNRSNDDPAAVARYDRAWFRSVLATVQLRPEDAVDTVPSASP
jgi:hypothetical protein